MGGCSTRLMIALILLVGFPDFVSAKQVRCPSGENRLLIDVSELAIHYDGSSLSAPIFSLDAISAHLTIDKKQLQKAAAATQQWNELLKGLAEGWNNCIISSDDYRKGLAKIYPRLKGDAADIEKLVEAINAGQSANKKQIERLLGDFNSRIRSLAQLAGKEQLLDQIESVLDKKLGIQTAVLLEEIRRLLEKNSQSPLAKPEEISTELDRKLQANAKIAKHEYNLGYEFYQQFRFREAIPLFESALRAVQLPMFYRALAETQLEVPDLDEAERIAQEGIDKIPAETKDRDEQVEIARLGAIIAEVRRARGDLPGSLKLAKRGLELAENALGPDHSEVADFASNLGLALFDNDDLDGAAKYTQRALDIKETSLGGEHPDVAAVACNLALIFQAQGNLAGASDLAGRALQIDEKILGPNHPDVAKDANNLGQILRAKGDLEGAIKLARRALQIEETVFGPDHPNAAITAGNLGQILKEKGDYKGAERQARRSIQIMENIFGDTDPRVGTAAGNLGMILKDIGNVEEALKYVERALEIDEKIFGPASHSVAIDLGNLALVLQANHNLDGAIKSAERALEIDKKEVGPDHPFIANRAGSLGSLLKEKGDLGGARGFIEQAIQIDEKNFGPKDPRVGALLNTLGGIRLAQGFPAEAVSLYGRSYEIFASVYGVDNTSTKKVAANLAEARAADDATKN